MQNGCHGETKKGRESKAKDTMVKTEGDNLANNAIQGPCGPCKGCPYGTRPDLAASAGVAPDGCTARVSCGSNYLCKKLFFKNN